MNPDTELAICTAPKYNSRHWKQSTITWGELVSWVDEPGRVKECGNYMMGTLRETTVDHDEKTKGCRARHRRNGAVVSRSAVTLDSDHNAKGLPDIIELTIPWACLVHTTYSSSPDDPRYRVILPADRPMKPEEYFMVANVLLERLGRERFDPTTVEPARYMFRPAAQHIDWFASWVTEGDALPVDELLAEYDPAILPAPKVHHNKRNPFELEGAVGAFNRAYEFEDVIEAYKLPYEPAGDRRWQLVGTTSEAGLGVVTDGLVYSHHANDPAWGQTCSAFDLVRLHRFGELDAETPETTPVNRRPSHQAMLDLAAIDPRVVAEMVGVDFDDEMDKVDWRLRLQLNARTGKFIDVIQNWDLVREHDEAFAGLYFNEMTLAVETDADLPWRTLDHGGPVFSGTDRAALAHYLEREYKLRPARHLVDELVEIKAQQRLVHPVREYLNGLTWDGEERLETCLPGVRPTPYTRMVGRKSMVAAAARIMEPGIKWDHSLVLFGDEGLGKSWWIEKVARGFSATLGRITDKDTLLTMQRTWIMVADEGHSLRKTDNDVQKEFLTRTADVFRMPYDREAQLHKRHCVIWSTTNDEVFLRRQQGNRRFLIVKCEEAVDFTAVTDEYVDQLWAEAMTYYRAGERLFLEGDEKTSAAAERERFTEEDALPGIIEAYLDTLVPESWDDMSPEARRLWMQNRADGFEKPGTQLIRRTCTAQIWVEVLGRRLGDHRRADLLDINNALKQLPGWIQLPGRHRLPNYGTQLAYAREDLL